MKSKYDKKNKVKFYRLTLKDLLDEDLNENIVNRKFISYKKLYWSFLKNIPTRMEHNCPYANGNRSRKKLSHVIATQIVKAFWELMMDDVVNKMAVFTLPFGAGRYMISHKYRKNIYTFNNGAVPFLDLSFKIKRAMRYNVITKLPERWQNDVEKNLKYGRKYNEL